MPRTTTELPDPSVDPDVRARLAEQPIALFLDYDGTLTPIVARPELAVLDEDMRAALGRVAARCVVGILSGRDLDDVRAMVLGAPGDAGATATDAMWFAGSHGFDVSAPDGSRSEFLGALKHVETLRRAADELDDSVAGIPGAWVERKRFAVAIHFRQVDNARIPEVEEAVEGIVDAHDGLRKTGGKRIFELRPDVEWDKGRALWSLFGRMGLTRGEALAVFIGDDVTDEDAFRALGDDGVGIVVADTARSTAADYRLGTPGDVRVFLGELAEILDGVRR